jgi:hypothetical protein
MGGILPQRHGSGSGNPIGAAWKSPGKSLSQLFPVWRDQNEKDKVGSGLGVGKGQREVTDGG